MIPHLRSQRRFSAASSALSAGTFTGRLRGCRVGSMASRVASILRLSWTLAAERVTAHGMSFLSTPRRRFASHLAAIRWIWPGCFTPPERVPSPSPNEPATSRFYPLPQAASATPGANALRLPPAARSTISANRSCHCHSPVSLGYISPGMPVINTTKIPVSTCRSGRGGRLLWVWAEGVAGAAGSVPQVHPR